MVDTNVCEEITAFVFRIEACGSVRFTEAESQFLGSNTAMVLYCTLRTLSRLFDNINMVQTEGSKLGADEDIWVLEEEVTGEWKKLLNEELRDLYFT